MASRRQVYGTDQVFPDIEVERGVRAGIGATRTGTSGDRDAVLAQAADADALLNMPLPLDGEAVAQAAGAVVATVPDYCEEEVAGHALALLRALLGRLPLVDSLVDAGAWGVQSPRPLQRLGGTMVGLGGHGRIARRLAEMPRPLGVRLRVHDPCVDPVGALGVDLVAFEELLGRADAAPRHGPLIQQTAGPIGAEQPAPTCGDAIPVNTSRGSRGRLEDLTVLPTGTIRGAGVDVFPEEPPHAGLFEGVPDPLLTSHVVHCSEVAIGESQRQAATQILQARTGRPPDHPAAVPTERR